MSALLHFLVGTWFVSYSNFPMWLKGDKTNPAFTYTLAERKGSSVLLDEVSYTKQGHKRYIRGYDYPDKKDSSTFTWKGKGLLGLLKSKWRVVLQDRAGQWAVIYFSKTLFTPEGVDLISRNPVLSSETLEQIRSLMEKDSLLKGQIASLKQISH